MKKMHQTVFKLVLLMLMTLLSACVPAPLGKYYKPVYSDSSATYSGNSCGGKAGAPALMTVALTDGVTLTIDAWRSYGEQSRKDIPLHITMQLPKGVQAQFMSNEIRVSSHAQNGGQNMPTEIEISAAVLIPSDGVVDMQEIAPTPFPDRGSVQTVTKFSANTAFYFSWKDNFVPSSISMDIPTIVLLDGAAKELLPMKLTANARKRPDTYPGQYKSSTSLIYANQASELALAQKYARCIKETPHLKCKQILLYDDGAFNLEQQGFNFSGRLYVFDVEKHSPFSGELHVEYQDAVKWKFVSNIIRMTDLSNMAQRTYQFDKFPLSFRYQVPLNTPVRGVNDAPHSKTTNLSINSSLGTENLQKYIVQLPPLLINGKLHQIKPVELEKRVFDFGMEPFNC